MNSHRWRRATTSDPEYGRICACGNLKDQQALRCRGCYADARRDEDARTCACGGTKHRQAHQCRSCANEAMRGAPVNRITRQQPQNHPWRKKLAA